MPQVRENLPLAFETGQDEVGVHPRPDQFDRDAGLLHADAARMEIEALVSCLTQQGART